MKRDPEVQKEYNEYLEMCKYHSIPMIDELEQNEVIHQINFCKLVKNRFPYSSDDGRKIKESLVLYSTDEYSLGNTITQLLLGAKWFNWDRIVINGVGKRSIPEVPHAHVFVYE